MSNLTLNSTANLTKPPRLRRKGLAVLLLATGAAVVFLPARRANAFLFDIVLDPIALVENVLKVVDLGEQIDAVVQQVENQVKELAASQPEQCSEHCRNRFRCRRAIRVQSLRHTKSRRPTQHALSSGYEQRDVGAVPVG